MNFFKKLLGFEENSKSEDSETGKFMPEPKTPVDELFMNNFRDNGGKFLYCETESDLNQSFNNILEENNWSDKSCYYYSESALNHFETKHLNLSNKKPSAEFFILECEYLIGNTGAVLISSNQIGDKRLEDLPYNFIVFAKTSQLLETIGEGLQRMKLKHKNSIPSNITTLKTFENENVDKSNFLSYGSTTKNLYLLLYEDF